MSTVFYYCQHCGNVIVKLHDGGPVPICCGETMERLEPHLSDPEEEIAEKHVPVVECLDDRSFLVKIGSMPHPMTDLHYISFIFVETKTGGQIVHLKPEDRKAEAFFCMCKEKPVAVYVYCNIHGLWKLNLNVPDSTKCCKTDGKC